MSISETKCELFYSDDFNSLRVFHDNERENISFAADDVCRVLDIKNSRDALSRLDEDEKGVALTDTLGGKQQINVVNEYGLYTLVMRSRKPEAKKFRRWVTHEVIPSIRKDGGYVMATAQDDDVTLMAKGIMAAQRALERVNAQLAEAAPKAGYFDSVMDGKSLESITEVARHIYQYDHKTTRDSLFKFLRSKGLVTADRQATKEAVKRGYLLNAGEATYTDPYTGEQKKSKPYAKVTPKGKAWLIQNINKEVA